MAGSFTNEEPTNSILILRTAPVRFTPPSLVDSHSLDYKRSCVRKFLSLHPLDWVLRLRAPAWATITMRSPGSPNCLFKEWLQDEKHPCHGDTQELGPFSEKLLLNAALGSRVAMLQSCWLSLKVLVWPHRTHSGPEKLCLLLLKLQTKHRLEPSINGGAFNCFDHNRFPQVLFPLSAVPGFSAKGKSSWDDFALNYLGIFKEKHLSALKILLLSPSCTELRQSVSDSLC